MRHQKKGKTLARKRNQRRALLKSMAVALFAHNQITTTKAKAKELQPFVERMITKGKADSLASRRYLARYFGATTVKRIMTISQEKFANRKGGYSRIIKLAPRGRDGAEVAVLELVD
jgi:large subunit ribosomal protein L17